MVVSNKFDFFFIKFPLVFPIIYLCFLNIFPEYEKFIILFTILFLAEPHFAATWPFMIDKKNKDMIFQRRIEFIFFPAIIILTSLLLFFFFRKEFFLIFYFANVYHVTRQSIGISKLYSNDKNLINFHEKTIYAFNIFLGAVGLLRFYIPVINDDNIIYLNLVFIVFLTIVIITYFRKFKYVNLAPLVTGVLIFYPICFVKNPVHAILMGVTMHYSQYIILTYFIGLRRTKDNVIHDTKIQLRSLMKKFKINFFTILFIYSLIMSSLSILGKSSNEILSQLILLPIIFQLLHFYLDGLLWRFSIKTNRENTLKYIFNH